VFWCEWGTENVVPDAFPWGRVAGWRLGRLGKRADVSKQLAAPATIGQACTTTPRPLHALLQACCLGTERTELFQPRVGAFAGACRVLQPTRRL
jgi:hypothetical protein